MRTVLVPMMLFWVGALLLVSCAGDDTPVPPKNETTAADVLVKGTQWIYENTTYDSAGVVLHSGAAYNDTVTIVRDTVINGMTWYVTSTNNVGGIYSLYGIGVKNGNYWRVIRGVSSMYNVVSTSPLFRTGMTATDTIRTVYCLMVSDGREVAYSRTLQSAAVTVSAGGTTYDCIRLREANDAADHIQNFDYQYYDYHAVYGLIRNEYYRKSPGGTVYLSSRRTLKSVTLGVQ